MIQENINTEDISGNPPKKISLSVFMPFYNEEENIEQAVSKVYTELYQLSSISHFEVIIVDDGSTDTTRKIAKSLLPLYKNLRLVFHETNTGYGGALTTGIRACSNEYVFFTDGDLQFDIVDIEKLLIHVKTHDAIIGYRIKRQDSIMRLTNALVWNILIRMFYGLQVKDINCAFKLLKRKLLIDLPLVSTGAMISSEILVRLQSRGVLFKEVPVNHLPRLKGRQTGAKVGVIVKALKELIALKDITSLEKNETHR